MKSLEKKLTRLTWQNPIKVMMMMIKKLLPALFLFLLSPDAASQDDDFGIWYSANAKVGVTDKINADLTAEMRTFGNAAKIEQWFLEAGMEYKLTGFLSAGLSYRLTDALEDNSKYYFQHKAFLDLKGNVKTGSVTFQGRLRLQTRFRTYIEDVQDQYPDYTTRIKLKVIYRTPSFPVNPYIYAESFIPLNKEPERFIGKNRFGAGVEYSISKKHSIEAGYLFQRDYLPKFADEHVINLGYNFKF